MTPRNLMESQISVLPHRVSESDDRIGSVVKSALWAAAGDALGWITELTTEDGLESRAGVSHVEEPISWRRIIGGRYGVRVNFPAGSYSDDTQLRLAVCRSIRGNGTFDAEAFAKIELTAWLSYSLGAGRGTKAAALNLTKRDVNWFSNFFSNKDQDYLNAGGNGAAMRIQPHVWSANNQETRSCILEVFRDAIVTHGHPHGFCGAIFHAYILSLAFKLQRAPSPSEWEEAVHQLGNIPKIIEGDGRLISFWLPAWESASGVPLHQAIDAFRDETLIDLNKLRSVIKNDRPTTYHSALDILGCTQPKFRGSGIKTAIAAAVLVWLHRSETPSKTLVAAANELDSDTDTIGTMAGAIHGAFAHNEPTWPLQDRSYIRVEAERLGKISLGNPQDSFAYPDVSHWSPPTNQSSAVGRLEDGFAILGLGPVQARSEEYSTTDSVWQWMELPFGQTILAKRKRAVRNKIEHEQLPGVRRTYQPLHENRSMRERIEEQQPELLPFESVDMQDKSARKGSRARQLFIEKGSSELDRITDEVIQANFDDRTLGRLLNEYIDRTGSIEGALAFASVIAKAKVARRKRRR